MHFDHTWLEIYYEERIAEAGRELRHIQDNASGYGEPHRKAEEAARRMRERRPLPDLPDFRS
jgi:hypothetical protein